MPRGGSDTYNIPPNFAEEGTMFSGRIRTRNLIEAVLSLVATLQPLLAMDLTTRAKIYIAAIVILPTVLFALIGIQGESLFGFAFAFIVYMKNKRVLGVPDAKYRLNLERRKRKALRRERGKGDGRPTGHKGVGTSAEGSERG